MVQNVYDTDYRKWILYNMVRIIAGTLVQVGKGQLSADDVAQMLEAKDRTAAGQTARHRD